VEVEAAALNTAEIMRGGGWREKKRANIKSDLFINIMMKLTISTAEKIQKGFQGENSSGKLL
jgi:hypothetical protein